MSLTRRKLLCVGAAALGAAALTGCESLENHFAKPPPPGVDALPPGPSGKVSEAARLLNRAAFGPRPGDIAYVERIGAAAYLEEQLKPDSIEEPKFLQWRLRSLGDSLNPDPGLLFDEDDKRLVAALRQATTLRAVYSKRQLQERMVEFWSDHFNIYAFKNEGAQLKIVDDHETIRKHGLGRFRDLLGASARSAAMLGYLDNGVNKRGAPNENYARELMELHTLGVNGGYTQRDVLEVARCLTGWTSQKHWRRGAFLFDSDAHDNGAKTVLGNLIPAHGGVHDGDRVLDIVAAHPATAHRISRKLCLYFLGEAPETLTASMAKTFQETDGDIKSLVRLVLNSSEVQSSAFIFKRPFDYAVSALRAFDVDTDGGAGVQEHLEKMGQSLFGWPMPNGYPTQEGAWLGGLPPRWNFALDLTQGRVQNTKAPLDALIERGIAEGLNAAQTLSSLALGRAAHDPETSPLLARFPKTMDARAQAACVLMSPDFQWR
ncbi:MAG: DUF1800 domain-containing protein [Capsulimonas sp.]|uniref:DUF1800 domain-containing protein n=1 Tax=Capsulimonas sp. TaxID=2494211 RepID=UPI00326671A9